MLRKIVALLKRKPRRYRSSITGKFVSKAFADANPATTYGERVA